MLGVAPALFYFIVRFVGKGQITYRCRLRPQYDQVQSLPKMVEANDPDTRSACEQTWAGQTAGVAIGCVALVACTVSLMAWVAS